MIIKKADDNGKWTTNRHTNYPTTDIEIDNIPDLESVKRTIVKNVTSVIREHYRLEENAEISAYDLFVVKYDSTGGQAGLGVHRESSEFSFVLLLSDPENFEGGYILRGGRFVNQPI